MSAENAADYGLKADGMYVDPEDGRQTWDTRWMGKVKVGDWCVKVRKFEWQQAGSTYCTLTDKEFLCFTDELAAMSCAR